MSDMDPDWSSALERTHEAVRKFARNELNAYARKIIYRMRRFPAVGIYEGAAHKTLWDEYRYEQHNGPSDPAVVMAWTQTLRPYLDEVLESISATTASLLTIYAVWDLEDSLEHCGLIWRDGIKESLKKSIVQEAVRNDKISW